jgi:branched-chain amino acid aminotransferase
VPRAGRVCIADQIALYPPEMYEQGMTVVVAERPRVPIACLDPRIKSLNYLNNILAKTEAIDRGLLEAIMLNTDGVRERVHRRQHLRDQGRRDLHAPERPGILEGITRRVRDGHRRPRVRLHRRRAHDADPIELLEADEVFLTGSAAEMIAVTGHHQPGPAGHDIEHVIGAGQVPRRPRARSRELRTKFREIVTSDSVPED